MQRPLSSLDSLSSNVGSGGRQNSLAEYAANLKAAAPYRPGSSFDARIPEIIGFFLELADGNPKAAWVAARELEAAA